MGVCVAAMNAQVELGTGTQQAMKQNSKQIKQAIDNHKTMQEPHLEKISSQMCKWAVPTYSSIGESIDRTAWVLAQTVLYASIIALNTYIQNQNYKIAKAYADMAEDKWNRFKMFYQPLEVKMILEASGTGEPSRDYAGARNRAVNASNFAFNSANQDLARYAKQYAMCYDESLTLDYDKARIRDDSINFNYRDTENYTYMLSDRRWNRRSDILNIGRNNEPTAFSYASSASAGFKSLGQDVANIGSGISGLLGYLNNRNETVYPANFAQASLYGNGVIMAGTMGTTTLGF